MHNQLNPVALVTAASRGIGAGCARELASRGYHVALMARTDDVMSLADELGGIGVVGSVTSSDDLQAFVNTTLDRYGRVDAVVNNTGHPAKGDLLELSDEQWHAGLDLLVLNVARMAKLVTPIFMSQGSGAIVNISTFSAFEPSLDFPISSSLRAALGGFTKLYADRYAADGIRMNNVLPGYTESYEVSEHLRASLPMRRVATVAEIAKTVAFLLSSDAGYITGQNIQVDGGLSRSL